MPFIVSKGQDFQPAPEGFWPAICCDMVDKGEQVTQWGKRNVVQLRFQLGEDAGTRDDGKPWLVVKSYTASLGEKANLRKDLEVWRSRRFTEDELKGWDLEKVVSVPCMLQIMHRTTDTGQVFANITAVTPLPKGVPVPVIRDYVREHLRQTDGVDVQAVRQSLQAGQVRQVDTDTGEITETAIRADRVHEITHTTPKSGSPSEASPAHDGGNAELAEELWPEEDKAAWNFKTMDETQFKAFCKVHELNSPKAVCQRLGVASWSVLAEIGFGTAASKIADMAANQ